MRRWLAGWLCLVMVLAAMPHGTVLAVEETPTWISRTSGTQSDLAGIASGGGRVVVVGKRGTALTSTTGDQWTAGTTGTEEDLKAVAYGGGQFVAVGNNGTVLVSTEGARWAGRHAETTEHLLDVAYGGGVFVAVGDAGTVLRATNGQSWTVQTTGAHPKLYSVAYGAGTFVAVGYDGAILTSPDGAGWTLRSSGTQRYLSGVAFGPGGFVAIGDRGTVLRSENGLSWSAAAVGDSSGLWQVAAGLGQYVGVGGAGRILSSPDGSAWTLNAAEPTLFLNDIAFVNGQFIAVGDEGKIRTSTAAPLVTGPPPGGAGKTKEPVADGEPGIIVRPEQVRCEQGVVAGTRVERKIGGLLIQADGAAKQEDQWETYCGNVSLNSVLKLDGVVKVHAKELLVRGDGQLYVETVLERYHGQIVLFEGQFELSGDLTELIKQQGLNHLKLAGLTVDVTKLKLLVAGVQVAGNIELPASLGAAKAAIENLEIVGGQIDIKGEVALPRLKLGNSGLGLDDAAIWLDSKEDTFGGRGTLVIPKMFDISGTIGFKQARLDSVGFSLSGLGLAIDTSGFYISSLSGKAEGLTDPSTMRLTFATSIYGGPMIVGYTAVKGEDLTLTVDLSGKVSGSGKLVLIEFLDVANGRFEISYAQGFSATLEIDIIDVIKANLDLRVGAATFHGSANGSLKVPDLVWTGGMEVGGARLDVDTAGISGEVRVPAFTVSLNYPWRGKLNWGVKGRWFWSHKVRHVASTALVAAAEPTRLDMPPGMEEAVVELRWDAGDADFTLKTPDGRSITPADAPLTSESMRFFKDPTKRFALYWLRHPAPGVWNYIVNTKGATTYSVELKELTPAPRLTFTGPVTDVKSSGAVPISWTSSAPAGSKLTLFYTKTLEDPGFVIVDGLDLSAGSYQWNPTGVPSGTYYIQGIVAHADSARVRVTAPGQVRIDSPNTPPVPQGLTARAADGALNLSWSPVSAPALGGYRIHLAGADPQSMAVGRETQFTWTGLQPGKTYQVAVSAYSTEGMESEPSTPVSVFLPVPAPPSLRIEWPEQRLTNQPELTIRGQVGQGATAVLYQDGTAIARGLSGSVSRHVTLHRGANRLRVVATGPSGDSAESEAEYFLDTTVPQLTILTLPKDLTVARAHAVLAGRVEPGARLSINGEPLPVRPDGTYILPLVLEKGTILVTLAAEDQAGNQNVFRGQITFTGSACGTLFADVKATHFDCEAVETLAGRKVIAGYPDGSFQPDRPVTRAEFAKMLVATLERRVEPGAVVPFADARDHWAATQGYVQAAIALGAISGFPDGTFRPNDPVTRAQMIKIVAAAVGLEAQGSPVHTDVRATDWFGGWAAVAEQAGLIGPLAAYPLYPGTNLDGNRAATRSDAAMILANLLGKR